MGNCIKNCCWNFGDNGKFWTLTLTERLRISRESFLLLLPASLCPVLPTNPQYQHILQFAYFTMIEILHLKTLLFIKKSHFNPYKLNNVHIICLSQNLAKIIQLHMRKYHLRSCLIYAYTQRMNKQLCTHLHSLCSSYLHVNTWEFIITSS